MYLRLSLLLLIISFSPITKAQAPVVFVPADTASINLNQFAYAIAGQAGDNYEKAKALLGWLSTNFEWMSTDYKKRTAKEIIVRKGGNCFELATVYMALLREMKLNYRPIAEINIHRYSEERGATAAQKIKDAGNRMSVFGKQHNDHRWVEIWDEKTGEWQPADPTMNIIGFDQWLKARAWFGERHVLNADISKDMIVPFALFVVSTNSNSIMEINRTSYYLVDKLDALYDHKLSTLPSWSKWVSGLQTLSAAAQKAFAGEENLHNYNEQIADLAKVYENLKAEYSRL